MVGVGGAARFHVEARPCWLHLDSLVDTHGRHCGRLGGGRAAALREATAEAMVGITKTFESLVSFEIAQVRRALLQAHRM